MRSPKKKEIRGNPTVLIPSLRKTKRNSSKEADEQSDDEVQVCQVRSAEGSPERSNTQRTHMARMYHQSPQRLSSSSRIPSDSWQDASTEPLVPPTPTPKTRDTEIADVCETPKPLAIQKTDDTMDAKALQQLQDSQEVRNAFLKKLQLQSSQPISTASSSHSWQDEPTEPIAPQNAMNESGFSIPKAEENTAGSKKRKIDDAVDPEALAKALRHTKENTSVRSATADVIKKYISSQPTPKEQVPKQPSPDKPAETAEGGDEEDDANAANEQEKKPTKEEEASRIAQEIDHLMKTVKCLPNYYKLVDKIGEGTFSTVYKALDIRRDYYDNSYWEPQLLESASKSFISPSSTPTRPTTTDQDVVEGSQSGQSSPKFNKDLSEFVALKRVYDTSSPRRIANEIKILKQLQGSKCIAPMITAFRQQENVFIVMPYIPHDEFKPSFHKMELIDIKYYMKSMFTALQQLHHHKILHRDVKPNNFLYNIRRRTGYLIDFGLAESEEDVKLLEKMVEKTTKASKFNVYNQTHHSNASGSTSSTSIVASNNNSLNTKPIAKMASSTSVLAALTNKENRAGSSSSSGPTTTPATTLNSATVRGTNRVIKGFIKNDPRLPIRANRAGTRGFRAPEILMRVTHQTCAIDIWAAGVILLCFLTNTYPFFISNDEADALVELGQVYGLQRMQDCARLNNRHFETNINIPKTKLPWVTLISILNKERTQTWSESEMNSAVDLLRRSLELDPNKRITADEALKMKFLQVD